MMGLLSNVLGQKSGLLGDDEALDLFLSPNSPSKAGKTKTRPHRAPQTAPNVVSGKNKDNNKEKRQTRSALNKPGKTRHAEDYDEEMVRTRKYWERWAAQASKDLLKNIYEDMGSDKPSKSLVYSGRCGPELKYKSQFHEDSDSEGTVISMLSTSTLDDTGKYITRRKKRKNVKTVKTDWEKLAKERANRGALDKLIRRDASHMERYMQGRHAPIQNVVQQTRASDLMEQQDQNLIKYTAYSRGLAGVGKSHSTENVLSAIHLNGHRRPGSRSLSTPLSRSTSAAERVNRVGYAPMPPATSRGTPSPAAIGSLISRLQRPESAVVNVEHEFQCDERERILAPKGPAPKHLASPFSADQDIPDIPADLLTQEKVDEVQVKGAFLRSVHRRMNATVKALDRKIGHGDTTDQMKIADGDKGRYTAADYARIPRYPQNIRIAPQLGMVIRQDIRQKMGKPRQKEIRVKDLRQMDAENPKLGRSFRNMVIFNWLNELERTDYMYEVGLDEEPEICDIEVKRARQASRYPQYGDVTDVLSNITTRPSSAYTSLYSGRVSDDEEEEEAQEDGLSMATGSACNISSAAGDD